MLDWQRKESSAREPRLAFSVFIMLFGHGSRAARKGPFFNSRTTGISIPWTYPLSTPIRSASPTTLSRTNNVVSLTSTVNVPGVTIGTFNRRFPAAHWGSPGPATLEMSACCFEFRFRRMARRSENMVRTSAEYSPHFRDPIFTPKGAWAFSNDVTAARAAIGGDMPIYARIFSADELVRGLRPGELGPYGVTASTAANRRDHLFALRLRAQIFSPPPTSSTASPSVAGRKPLLSSTSAPACCFPTGWAPPSRYFLGATNGVLHGLHRIRASLDRARRPCPGSRLLRAECLRLNRFLSFRTNLSSTLTTAPPPSDGGLARCSECRACTTLPKPETRQARQAGLAPGRTFLHYEGREVSTEKTGTPLPRPASKTSSTRKTSRCREGVLSRLAEKLYAQDRWAVLVVLQGLDAAGKDGVVKHVMSA